MNKVLGVLQQVRVASLVGSVPGFRKASLCAGQVAFLVSGRLPCAGDKVKSPSAARLEVGRAALGIQLGRCVESRSVFAAREFRGVLVPHTSGEDLPLHRSGD